MNTKIGFYCIWKLVRNQCIDQHDPSIGRADSKCPILQHTFWWLHFNWSVSIETTSSLFLKKKLNWAPLHTMIMKDIAETWTCGSLLPPTQTVTKLNIISTILPSLTFSSSRWNSSNDEHFSCYARKWGENHVIFSTKINCKISIFCVKYDQNLHWICSPWSKETQKKQRIFRK